MKYLRQRYKSELDINAMEFIIRNMYSALEIVQ